MIDFDYEPNKDQHKVFQITTIDGKEINNWVLRVAEKSGQKVDWYYEEFGAACVFGLGDLNKIRKTIKELLPELNELVKRHKKIKWGVDDWGDTYTTEHVDHWEQMENDTNRDYGYARTCIS